MFGIKRGPSERTNGAPRKCEGCGKSMQGETPKLMSLTAPGHVLVHFFCSKKCAETLVASFLDQSTCIWCGKPADKAKWKLGYYGEPYCSDNCFHDAGREMFRFEFREGNI